MEHPHLAALLLQLLRWRARFSVMLAESLVQRQRHLQRQQVPQQLEALDIHARSPSARQCSCNNSLRAQIM